MISCCIEVFMAYISGLIEFFQILAKISKYLWSKHYGSTNSDHSTCSMLSGCEHTSYAGLTGHHERCECGFRFNCMSKPHQYCEKLNICTNCCIKQMHRYETCKECNQKIAISCKGIAFDITDGICRDCQICTICMIPYYKTNDGIEYEKGVCQSCYELNTRIVECSKRKCKRRITINLLNDDQNNEYYCNHPCCKKRNNGERAAGSGMQTKT